MCSSGRPRVSGTQRHTKTMARAAKIAYSQNVQDLPRTLINVRNVTLISRFALQLATVAALAPTARSRFGKSSAVISQNSGEMDSE